MGDGAASDWDGEVAGMGDGKPAQRGCSGDRDNHECVGCVRHRGAAGELCGGGTRRRGEADRGGAGKNGQERYRMPDPPADRGHCAGGLGAASGSARTARDDLVPQSAGENQHDDTQPSAKPDPPPQPNPAEGDVER